MATPNRSVNGAMRRSLTTCWLMTPAAPLASLNSRWAPLAAIPRPRRGCTQNLLRTRGAASEAAYNCPEGSVVLIMRFAFVPWNAKALTPSAPVDRAACVAADGWRPTVNLRSPDRLM